MATTSRADDALFAATEALLQVLRLRFYAQRPADYRRDRPRLLHALTWPATWLEARGLTCTPSRYQMLIEQRIHAIAAHGNPAVYSAYFPTYLLKCLQDWFEHHGDDLYDELKHIRNALDQVLASARFAEQSQRDARLLDSLVATHRLLARRPGRSSHGDASQLTLF